MPVRAGAFRNMVRRKPDNRFFTETRNFSGEAASLINERDEQRRAAGSREIAPNRLCPCPGLQYGHDAAAGSWRECSEDENADGTGERTGYRDGQA